MSRTYHHLIWLVFLVIALTASLPWWSHAPSTTPLNVQTAILIALALVWLSAATWWSRTNMHIRIAISLCWWVVVVDQLICLAVLAGAIWGAWWVSSFPWLHLSLIARLLFLLVLAIGGIGWFIEAIAVFWVSFAYDIGEITLAHYRSRRSYRRRRGF